MRSKGNRVDAFWFVDTQLARKWAWASHAVALDERRNDFKPTSGILRPMSLSDCFPEHTAMSEADIQAHNESSLSDGALNWMMGNLAQIGMPFSRRFLARSRQIRKVRPISPGSIRRGICRVSHWGREAFLQGCHKTFPSQHAWRQRRSSPSQEPPMRYQPQSSHLSSVVRLVVHTRLRQQRREVSSCDTEHPLTDSPGRAKMVRSQGGEASEWYNSGRMKESSLLRPTGVD